MLGIQKNNKTYKRRLLLYFWNVWRKFDEAVILEIDMSLEWCTRWRYA